MQKMLLLGIEIYNKDTFSWNGGGGYTSISKLITMTKQVIYPFNIKLGT